jgi:hypothetical protein
MADAKRERPAAAEAMASRAADALRAYLPRELAHMTSEYLRYHGTERHMTGTRHARVPCSSFPCACFV